MKITNLSLAAIAAVAMTTGAMAEDSKGIDFKIGGQAVVYYQTMDGKDVDQFNKDGAKANAGLQLDLSSDLGHGFGLGLQGTALNTLGLENDVVTGTLQGAGGDGVDLGLTKVHNPAENYFAITKAYITKKAGNTLIKAGRQELPKSLSPLAFTEGWSVFKNTFDAVLLINSDIPDTTVVGAYVDQSNQNGTFGDLGTFDPFTAQSTLGTLRPDAGAYMLTAQNKSLDGLTLTGSYYALPKGTATPGVDVLWGDAQADLNKLAALPVKFGLQGGQLDPDGIDATTAVGAKIAANTNGVDLSLAYSKVGTKGVLNVQNVGTGVKTPLYTQMILNQNHIAKGNDTFVLGASMPVGTGKVIAKYDMTTDNTSAKNDYQELDLIYKFTALDMNMFAAYVMQNSDNKTLGAGATKDDKANLIRFWTRYNF